MKIELGLWAREGVPRKGWHLVGFGENEDLQTCEMCQHAQIRYVFEMEHPRWPDRLAVGCVCAEHMAEERAHEFRAMEGRLRNINARRRSFPDLKAWRETRAGNLELRHRDGCRFVINRHRSYVTAMFEVAGKPAVWGRRRYRDERVAKVAAFDAAVRAGWLR